MKLGNLLAKLEKSPAYKDFKNDKESKDAFFCAAFLIMNFKQKIFENSLDFRNNKNIFTFKIPEAEDKKEITMQKEELIASRKPLEKINKEELKKLKTDAEDLKEIIQNELDKNKIQTKLDEAIAVLQSLDGKLIWNLTCICAGFTILSLHIDALDGKVLKFEKKNLLDFVSVKKPDKTEGKK
jgi:hypothetical protein